MLPDSAVLSENHALQCIWSAPDKSISNWYKLQSITVILPLSWYYMVSYCMHLLYSGFWTGFTWILIEMVMISALPFLPTQKWPLSVSLQRALTVNGPTVTARNRRRAHCQSITGGDTKGNSRLYFTVSASEHVTEEVRDRQIYKGVINRVMKQDDCDKTTNQ